MEEVGEEGCKGSGGEVGGGLVGGEGRVVEGAMDGEANGPRSPVGRPGLARDRRVKPAEVQVEEFAEPEEGG